MQYFNLPDPGEGLVEAEIVTWRVAVGDEIKVNDVVVEVETSKSLVELPSPFAGTVTELLVEEGATVDVGTPIIAVDDGSGAASPAPSRSGQADGDEAAAPNLVGYGVKKAGTSRRPRRAAAAAVPAEESASRAQAQVQGSFDPATQVSRKADEVAPLRAEPAGSGGEPLPTPGRGPSEPTSERGPVLAKPPTRLLAKQLGVDLATVTGTGDGGIITRADVERAAASTPIAPTPDALSLSKGDSPTGLSEERIPVKGVRKLTAEAMVRSAFTAPHVTEWVEVDVTATMELLDRLRRRRDLAEVRLTPLVLVASAVCRALRRNPDLNARWEETADGAEIVRAGQVDLGIAADTPRGLVVPKIRAADRLGLVELADALTALVRTAREGRTPPADLAGGTFTITNVGVFGVDGGTPILNPGESGILCIGAINRRPWVVGTGAEERIEPRWVTTLSVSFDHRVVDGAEGSQFLSDVALMLSDPAMGGVL
ncbi:2-oxo acid dehydrogenase subunit E2 [Desertihabitans brevis]|uniref:Dihydrolipoamide acetyltransferase component of pyruvate dehydrogenase complex n=1 Tax=Desertihabitans brevis TaxID=2268447 RepID=A0A367YR78_9ACTN|nr:dihydrolipoamide acetyltransferase family protein [Desertihabitans brevis]RCK68395.1 2-oxo acid dehydrogenase subunit E2 [Desertihabitans brevis]